MFGYIQCVILKLWTNAKIVCSSGQAGIASAAPILAGLTSVVSICRCTAWVLAMSQRGFVFGVTYGWNGNTCAVSSPSVAYFHKHVRLTILIQNKVIPFGKCHVNSEKGLCGSKGWQIPKFSSLCFISLGQALRLCVLDREIAPSLVWFCMQGPLVFKPGYVRCRQTCVDGGGFNDLGIQGCREPLL